MDRQVPDKLQPDLEAIARNGDLLSLGKLLQLILGCAINCENKEKHIEIMTKLSLEVKQALKVAIDELENFEDHSNLNTDAANNSFQFSSNINFPIDRTHTIEEFNKIQEELSMVTVLKDTALQKCSELESMMDKLKEEKRNLKFENDKLIEKLSKMNLNDNPQHRFDSIENENLFQRLNSQVAGLQTELTRMEEQKEDYKINLEFKEKEYQKLLLQNDQLQAKLNEFKYDRDELDRLKYLNEEIIKYKNINELQKKKLEEYQEYKKQMKTVEDRNSTLIKQICELEEEKKSIAVLKSKLDLLKQQRDDLRAKCNEETFRADKNEDEIKRVYKKYNDSVQANEKMRIELENLKAEFVNNSKNDNINAPSIDMDLSTHNQLLGVDIGQFYGNERNNLIKRDSTDANEKLIRLEYENEKLKKELKNSNDEKIKLLDAQLEDEKIRVNKLESENRANCQRIIELEGQLRDLKPLNIGTNTNDHMNGNNPLKLKLNELQAENVNLKLLLEKKNSELMEHEERFKKHVSKAKETYATLETHVNNAKISNSLPDTSKVPQSDDICYWKNLCQQKDLDLEKLRQEFEQKNAFRDIEEQMISVSYHKLVRIF